MAGTDCSLQVVRVFISSPGDVAAARQAARKAVQRVDRLVARHNGILLEPIGWEDIPAGKAKRTQELMNPYVRAADIYIGILNKRFGTPTGQAESGTVEEYDLICQRWQEEDPKPYVKLYFKRLSQEETEDPEPQLSKVIDFKQRISGTDLYHEFESAEELGDRIEEELAPLVYEVKARIGVPHEPGVRAISEGALDLISKLLDMAPCTCHGIARGLEGQEAANVLGDLQARGLVRISGDQWRLSDSTEAFLAIAKHMFEADRHRHLLQSKYYQDTLSNRLPEIVLSRFHYRLAPEQQEVLRKLAVLSPATAKYVLLGDTESYDNLDTHAKSIGKEAFAQDMLWKNLVHRVAMEYGTDIVAARCLDSVDGQTIEATLFGIRLAAAHAEGKAFSLESAMPTIRVRTSGSIDKGQIVSGSPDFPVRVGTLMMNMEEYELALREFDAALAQKDIGKHTRVVALNNKGLVFLRQKQHKKAVPLFKEVLELDPENVEAKSNLELAESKSP